MKSLSIGTGYCWPELALGQPSIWIRQCVCVCLFVCLDLNITLKLVHRF